MVHFPNDGSHFEVWSHVIYHMTYPMGHHSACRSSVVLEATWHIPEQGLPNYLHFETNSTYRIMNMQLKFASSTYKVQRIPPLTNVACLPIFLFVLSAGTNFHSSWTWIRFWKNRNRRRPTTPYIRSSCTAATITAATTSASSIRAATASGASLTTTSCRGVPRTRRSTTTLAAMTTTSRWDTARMPTCWCTSETVVKAGVRVSEIHFKNPEKGVPWVPHEVYDGINYTMYNWMVNEL